MIPPDEVLPCGCLIRCAVINGERTMMYISCKTTCVNFTNMLSVAEEEDKPVEYRNA